ncbi:GIY-YIG nuclease family protein [Aliiroseovarius sp. M344]|uniref:GIY-YIG nuclease family protein n=1 Tax=Aliiroseovarius sp. M344 TaxID=2867010 RepID=UPI0021AE2776|nr:GIY-YIG nuclease family protein [Aliiroseovarius sp. M344]UWQ13071.1 GIY-YIG nuclease family protein [Aliiroseovarius sp. M344]
MPRPTLDDIFSESDEFGLLEVKPRAACAQNTDRGLAVVGEVNNFFEKTGHLPNPDAADHEEMRLGTIWEKLKQNPTDEMLASDHLGLLVAKDVPQSNWREDPHEGQIPDSLDDIFDDDALDLDEDAVTLRHVTPSAERHLPDHRAEFVPCTDFDRYAGKFEEVQVALESGERKARPVKKWAVIEPVEGDFFIRNGLLAMIAEKSEMTARGGSRDHRLRVIFSNGTESDPLMSSFRKSLNDDKASRFIEKVGLGPLDAEWEADRVGVSGTIYVARSLSEDPAIKNQSKILHKIGVTSQDVRRRVADARNDPTFLLAPVEVVATFDLENLPREKVEHLLHKFFERARPSELFILDRFGKKVHPKEWFYVLPEHVSQAAKLLLNGELHKFAYDVKQQAIVKR